jgi:hypothetical protein
MGDDYNFLHQYGMTNPVLVVAAKAPECMMDDIQRQALQSTESDLKSRSVVLKRTSCNWHH